MHHNSHEWNRKKKNKKIRLHLKINNFHLSSACATTCLGKQASNIFMLWIYQFIIRLQRFYKMLFDKQRQALVSIVCTRTVTSSALMYPHTCALTSSYDLLAECCDLNLLIPFSQVLNEIPEMVIQLRFKHEPDWNDRQKNRQSM